MAENILFICGSLNQTTMMHQIARQLGDYNCFFTPYYADGIEDLAARIGLLNFTVLGGRHLQDTRAYLADNNLPIDDRGKKHHYDLVVTCSDLIVPNNVRGKRLVLVQEGITEPEGLVYQLVKRFKLPRYLANTATMGLSDAYDIFCVASHTAIGNTSSGKVRGPKKLLCRESQISITYQHFKKTIFRTAITFSLRPHPCVKRSAPMIESPSCAAVFVSPMEDH